VLRSWGVVVLLVSACPPSSPGGGRETAKVQAPLKKSQDAVKLEFFVMSQCPYGVQVVNAVKDVVDKLGPDLDFTMDFIGTKGANGELSSMHGPNEVTGDIVQLCAAKAAPANYLAMAVCQNKTVQEVATNWEQCAKEAQLPVGRSAPASRALRGAAANGIVRPRQCSPGARQPDHLRRGEALQRAAKPDRTSCARSARSTRARRSPPARTSLSSRP